MQIISRIAALLGIAGLAVIVAEVINHTTWLALNLHPVSAVVSLVGLYALYQWRSGWIRRSAERGQPFGKIGKAVLGTTRSIYFLLGIIALLSIPLLWWGVINKLAAMAGNGKAF